MVGLFRVYLGFDDFSYSLDVLRRDLPVVFECLKAPVASVVTEYGHGYACEVGVKTLQELEHFIDELLSLIHMSSFVL